ncbi:MAG: bifunctional oligoribonuclease/PAP phosphatase NrnA [Bacteroidetes bacterium]|jgi:phosphoesterase RecJ-like protein|nr:bifunctional oligoribonuclease/PAP phosphatase NrnA [Bacteroidota bacterium]
MQNENIQKLHNLIQSSKNIVVIGHKNPDGDAVGSCMAWGLFLKHLKHNVSVIMPNPYPEFLNWVPNQDQILIYSDDKENAQKAIKKADLIFTLDFNHLSRVGEELQKALDEVEKPFVMIDHHEQPDDYAEVCISHPEYGSTAELVFECIDLLNFTEKIDKDIASCLYLGIMTDTGSFKFSSTTARTHQIAAKLIDKGAVAHQIQQQTFDANSYSRLKLLGQAMQNLEYLEDLGVAYIHLSQQELDKHNFKKGDTEGFVNYGLSIKNVALAAIFKEDVQQNIVKISFRSKGNFDVNQLARQHFEGGGHKNAAGGKSELSLDATIKKFVSLLPDYKTQLHAAF